MSFYGRRNSFESAIMFSLCMEMLVAQEADYAPFD